MKNYVNQILDYEIRKRLDKIKENNKQIEINNKKIKELEKKIKKNEKKLLTFRLLECIIKM